MQEQRPRPTAELCDQITSEIDAALADNEAQLSIAGLRHYFMTPKVTEIPRAIVENNGHDDFIDPNQGELF